MTKLTTLVDDLITGSEALNEGLGCPDQIASEIIEEHPLDWEVVVTTGVDRDQSTMRLRDYAAIDGCIENEDKMLALIDCLNDGMVFMDVDNTEVSRLRSDGDLILDYHDVLTEGEK